MIKCVRHIKCFMALDFSNISARISEATYNKSAYYLFILMRPSAIEVTLFPHVSTTSTRKFYILGQC